MINIKINDSVHQFDSGITLEAIKTKLNQVAYAATVNNRIRELTYVINKDCEVKFLDLNNRDAVRIYEASLRYVIAMAIKKCIPGSKC